MKPLTGPILAALGFMACASALHAETGTLFQRSTPATIERAARGGVEVRRVIDQYAACLVHKRRPQVRRILDLPSASREQEIALDHLIEAENNIDTNCLGNGKLHLGGIDLRGSLYASLVRETYDDSPAILPVEQRDFLGDLRFVSADPTVTSTAQLLSFASCVIHHDPENARLAVLGPAGSPREGSAFVALSPNFSQCLVSGNTIKFDKANLVGLIAEAYYREAASVKSSETN